MAITAIDDDRPIVDVQSVAKTYGGWALGGRRNINALRGVSLKAKAGEVFGLLGPNGAGKTTLIKVLLGVVTPSSGTASLFGEPVGSSAARARVGYLPESLRVDRHHTARSALRYYGRLSRMSAGDIARRSDELLELVGLQGRDKESVKRFSKGMNQRLGLAQALMHDPDLLVLDEPTDGLDPVGRSEVRKVIERLRDAGKTIFLNSHILHEVEMVCTRVAILAGGEIRGSGTLEELSNASQSQQLVVDICLPTEEHYAALQTELSGQTDDCEWLTAPHGRATHRLIAKLPDQKNVDKIVDQLRARDVSIVGLDVKRPTLEDTFMKLVGPAEADA